MSTEWAKMDAGRMAGLVVESLVDEVRTTPKPGLVDEANSGSHSDMDLDTFLRSADALWSYFYGCVRLGQRKMSVPETFSLLRRSGRKAEKLMYRTTGGVNTHKGAIFTMGLLCGSLGMLWEPEKPIPPPEKLLETCADLANCALEQDFSSLSSGTTAGERLYLQSGLTGIRGEAAAGLPSVTRIGLPAFRKALEQGFSPNDAGAVALRHLIAQVEDTNLYHRGGADGAAWAKKEAEKLLPLPAMDRIRELDEAFIRRNLSPGGCADLLAVTLFLHKLDMERAAV
jgi:holo-ACP synthase/triphosphoribosyl-dephospho-CoA synthase